MFQAKLNTRDLDHQGSLLPKNMGENSSVPFFGLFQEVFYSGLKGGKAILTASDQVREVHMSDPGYKKIKMLGPFTTYMVGMSFEKQRSVILLELREVLYQCFGKSIVLGRVDNGHVQMLEEGASPPVKFGPT